MLANMAAEDGMRTAAWYGDRPLKLTFPRDWSVMTLWPKTPPPLSDAQIITSLEHPVGQVPIRELARGKTRPVVIVDDLTRPTPAGQVMPFLLRQLADAGISPDAVTVVMGTGTHGRASVEAITKKVGQDTGCRLVPHDDSRNLARVGRTSFDTPVLVNREVMSADLVIGIGGIFPNFSTGFGGGSKLALGVLGKRSISRLHFGHRSMSGSYSIDNDFRRDLDEIAKMIGLNTMISLHVDAWRRPVQIMSGDHHVYYKDAVEFAREAFQAPRPETADVVIVNAYPVDVSLHFTRSKGRFPFSGCKPSASRVLVSACSEGVGHHGLFPYEKPRFHRQRKLVRKLLADPRAVPAAIKRRAQRKFAGSGRRTPATRDRADQTPQQRRQDVHERPVGLFITGESDLPSSIPGIATMTSWSAVVDGIEREQGRTSLEVAIYPCSPLQILQG